MLTVPAEKGAISLERCYGTSFLKRVWMLNRSSNPESSVTGVSVK